MSFKKFNFTTIDEIKEETKLLNSNLNFSNDFNVYKKPLNIDGFMFPNSLALHPMEGCDGKADGSPDELTVRRYERFAKGGDGLIKACGLST